MDLPGAIRKKSTEHLQRRIVAVRTDFWPHVVCLVLDVEELIETKFSDRQKGGQPVTCFSKDYCPSSKMTITVHNLGLSEMIPSNNTNRCNCI